MKKSNLMPSLVLGCICLVVALLLSVVNMFTAPVIEAANEAAANAALAEVLPGGTNFEEIEITADYPAVVTKGYKADGGYVFQMSVVGYKPGLVIMCGVDSDGKIAGVKHIQSSETYGLEGELNGVYVGETLDSAELIIATGASKNSNTSRAYFDAIKAALQSAVIAAGGSVDTRTPEQILQDNCNAALGTEGKTFTAFFSSWSELGDAKVYTADAGVVINIGETFVGYLNGSDTPVSGGTAETAAVFTTYSSLEKVDLSAFTGIGNSVKAVYKNADGEYMFSLSRKGFEWAPAPMVIELIINSEGTIVSCVTVSHSESGGYGSVCGEPEYYEQYVGKTAETYTEVPNITATADGVDPGLTGGATQTSDGYKTAVAHAFSAFAKITEEGGNE